ncbi:MAG: group III truncated hemoglobin [Chitinophagaceae bacterium]
MQRDIENKEDITKLVNEFYSRAVNDETIGHIFKNITGFSFETHIPIMVSFWETLLFGTAGYKGNPMAKHIALNKLIPLEKTHFNQWLALWEKTIHENFAGIHAKDAIAKSKNIARIMQAQIKMNSAQ